MLDFDPEGDEDDTTYLHAEKPVPFTVIAWLCDFSRVVLVADIRTIAEHLVMLDPCVSYTELMPEVIEEAWMKGNLDTYQSMVKALLSTKKDLVPKLRDRFFQDNITDICDKEYAMAVIRDVLNKPLK